MASADQRERTYQLSTSPGGYELVFTPLLFGVFGYWLDGRIGIRPVLTVVLSVFAVVGAVASYYLRYRRDLDEETSKVVAERTARAERRRAERAAAAAALAAEREALAAELEKAEAAFRNGPEGQVA